jgi:hypothetical protein
VRLVVVFLSWRGCAERSRGRGKATSKVELQVWVSRWEQKLEVSKALKYARLRERERERRGSSKLSM